ncbi:MAG: hypothetical protein J5618_02065, partial [Bacilli bacterium]|nr:hypothetical protein [Bacilli bacterium]
MGYKEEFLKQLNELKKYEKLRQTNPEEALKFKNVLKAQDTAYQVLHFATYLNNKKVDLFGSREAHDDFINRHRDLLGEDRVPLLDTDGYGSMIIPDVDYIKIFEEFEKECIGGAETLEQIYKESVSNYQKINHPMKGMIDGIKNDVDTLFEGKEAKDIKEALDYANEEIVEKLGENLVDTAIDITSNASGVKAVKEYKSFLFSKNLDANTLKNQSLRDATVSAGFDKEKNIPLYKEFLNMEPTYDEDYKEKLLGLNALLEEEGLLQDAEGGESGSKEYGLTDYFKKNYILKDAIVRHSKLTDEAAKKASLANINQLSKDLKDVSKKYDKVLNYIEKNFDVENMNLNANIYSGRPSTVTDGDVDNWKPNLPPKYDFENSPSVIFLSGFTQLKAACRKGEVSLKEYLDHSTKAYIKGAKTLGESEDRKYYLPRSEENTLGKRLAHALNVNNTAYHGLMGYNMVGGRGMEFLYKTDPNKEKQTGNIIISSINKEYNILFNHDPDSMFGVVDDPNIQALKNVFVAGDKVDKLYELSDKYYNEHAVPSGLVKNYRGELREHGQTSVADEYRRVMKTLKDYALERKAMYEQNENIKDYDFGNVLYAGKQYFTDYLKENNLSLASVEDDRLRDEITDFMIDPTTVVTTKYVRDADLDPEGINDVKRSYIKVFREHDAASKESFNQKFATYNNKPNGFNVGKNMAKIVADNKGGWWERFRGTTSKEYTALQKVAKTYSSDNPLHADKESLYICAKAYKNYKMPAGTDFNRLSKTAQKRVEFCDSIIKAYEAEQREKDPLGFDKPVNNNNIIQEDFQNQLQNDLQPKVNKAVNAEIKPVKVNEKDPPDSGD